MIVDEGGHKTTHSSVDRRWPVGGRNFWQVVLGPPNSQLVAIAVLCPHSRSQPTAPWFNIHFPLPVGVGTLARDDSETGIGRFRGGQKGVADEFRLRAGLG